MMVFKTLINEEHFNLEILEWNDFTLGMLKLFSDWKLNGQQYITIDTPIEKEIENHMNSNMKNHVNNNVKINVKKKPITNFRYDGGPLFEDSELICKKSKYGNISIYKPIVNYLLRCLPNTFDSKEIRTQILNFYTLVIKKKITEGTSQVYGGSYRKYLIDEGLIKLNQDGETFIKIDKKNQVIKNLI